MSLHDFYIYHTNDVHSHFDQWGKIVTYIKHQRMIHKRKNESCLYFDVGDHTDRFSTITEGSTGKANVLLLNDSSVSGVTIGNNEGITFSKEELSHLYDEASFPVLVANVKNEDQTRPEWMKPYAIYTLKNGINVGVIGVTIPYELFYQLLGWKVEDPLTILPDLVKEVRQQADIVIVLSHLGLMEDEKIAETIDGIDIILGGHTHHLLKHGQKTHQTMIAQAGRYGYYVGQIKVTVEQETKTITSVSAGCIPIETVEKDKDTTSLIQKLEQKAEANLSEVVATLREPIGHAWFEPSPLANLLAKGLKEWCKAEIGMVNAGVLLHALPKGDITYRYIHEICPHPINPCKITLRGDKLKEIIAASFTKEMQTLRLRGLGFRGRVIGMMAFSGIKIETEILKDGYAHVTGMTMNGCPIDTEREYTIATLDMFTFGSLFPEMRQAQKKQYYMPEFIRQILIWSLTQFGQ